MHQAPQPGTTIAGKYRVERVLGKGGMGIVVEATQLDLARRVALKFLLVADESTREQLERRFEREARAAGRLRGPHVAHVLDIGRLSDGGPFIVMEFLEGRDLAGVLDASGPLPVDEAVGYMLQACQGVAEAHAAGIIHRDLKPENLFLTRSPDGRPLVKILDFGISKLTNDDALTATQSAMGSPLYMSPEQLESTRDVSATSDIWALGTILYELLAGRAAFAGETTVQVYRRIIGGRPDPLPKVRDDVPEDLEAIIFRCLDPDRTARFPTVADLAVALVPFGPPGADAFASAAVRMIRASSLAHSDLPRPMDSLPPRTDQTVRDPLVRAVVSGVGENNEQAQTNPEGQRRVSVTAVTSLDPKSSDSKAVPSSEGSAAETLRAVTNGPGASRERRSGPVPVTGITGDGPPEGNRRWMLGAVAVAVAGVLGFLVIRSEGPSAEVRGAPEPTTASSGSVSATLPAVTVASGPHDASTIQTSPAPSVGPALTAAPVAPMPPIARVPEPSHAQPAKAKTPPVAAKKRTQAPSEEDDLLTHRK